MSRPPNLESLPDGTGARVRLPSGRFVGVREAGDPRGWPLFWFTGAPGSRLSPLADGDAPRRAGARVIVVERPGFGVSDLAPGRRVLDWPADVTHVADALGVESFAVAGMAVGAAYVAACAYALPDRVRAAGLVGAFAPFQARSVRGSMTLRRRLVYRALSLTSRSRRLVRAIGLARIQRATNVDLPDCDKQIVTRLKEPFAVQKREALRQGPEGLAWDLALAAQPWGFRLEDIRVPVHLWHGDRDVCAPPAMGRHLAASIAGCRASFVAGAGHFLVYDIWPAVLQALGPTPGS
jgi:pimeloyl-ACP methyl ester carboxylesterase